MSSNPLIERVNAAQTVFKDFVFCPFDWGKADCAHLAAANLIALGYPDPLAKIRRYSTESGAKRALMKSGHERIEDFLDNTVGLSRIPPARALPGDIVGLPGEGDWTALGVVIDADRVLAFVDYGSGVRGELGSLNAATKAWSAPPLRRAT